MSRTTKAQLQAEVEALRHNLERALTEVERLKAALAAKEQAAAPAATQSRETVQRPAQRPARRVFEFNPLVPGDYARACQAARANNGIVRRAA